ncbi:MAG: hypothetical protein ACR2LT_00535 [Pyrinomonadaceae bacterium]
MEKICGLFIAILVCGLIVQADSKISGKILNPDEAALEIAKTTLAAHGGDKFKNMKTLIVRGTAEVSGSPTQTISATFAFVYAGEKYRVDINNPFQPLKQIFDGEQTYSSINGFSLPPLNRLGLSLLQKIGTEGFIVSALPEKLKNKKGFRITSPEGYYTDFLVDNKTGQVKSYESSYEIRGRTITTSVDIDKVRNVDGVILPEQYAQRFDLGNLTIYSDFKAKEILVNSIVNDDVFAIPK